MLAGFSDNELKQIVDELNMDDAVDIVEEMPANLVKRILSQAEPDTRRLINEMLKYPDDSAGSLMTTEYVDLSPDMTAGEAIDHIRARLAWTRRPSTSATWWTPRQLVGVVSLRTIILADKDRPVVGLHGKERAVRGAPRRIRSLWPRPSQSTISRPCPWWIPKTGWWAS
jgi:magnesium transporter